MTSDPVLDRPADPEPARLPRPSRQGTDTALLRQQLATALAAMLDQVEREALDLHEVDHGLSVMLEHGDVRCVLVVSAQPSRHALSPRELQIVRLVAEGATNRAIASSLDISLWTVSTHVRRIFAKLGVGSRAEMVAQFYGSSRPDSRSALPRPAAAAAGSPSGSPARAR